MVVSGAAAWREQYDAISAEALERPPFLSSCPAGEALLWPVVQGKQRGRPRKRASRSQVARAKSFLERYHEEMGSPVLVSCALWHHTNTPQPNLPPSPTQTTPQPLVPSPLPVPVSQVQAQINASGGASAVQMAALAEQEEQGAEQEEQDAEQEEQDAEQAEQDAEQEEQSGGGSVSTIIGNRVGGAMRVRVGNSSSSSSSSSSTSTRRTRSTRRSNRGRTQFNQSLHHMV